MRRRSLLHALAFSLAALAAGVRGPRLAPAAEPDHKVVRVGLVHTGSAASVPRFVGAFRERLRELGYVEGQNIIIEERWADGRIDRLPVLMAELIGRKVDVLVTYGTPAGIAAKKATSTTPIVVAGMADPVGIGLVASLARPGGNLTGLSLGLAEIEGKWLELLRETVPRLSTLAVIANLDNPVNRSLAKELEAIAATRRLKLLMIPVGEPEALDPAFERARRQAQAVLVLTDPMMTMHRGRIAALAAKHRLPGMYPLRDFADAGGLMAYAPDVAVEFRRAAEYVDKILKGAKPADLPIEQPTQYELIVNLKTARALGLTIPDSILLRADEVIR